MKRIKPRSSSSNSLCLNSTSAGPYYLVKALLAAKEEAYRFGYRSIEEKIDRMLKDII